MSDDFIIRAFARVQGVHRISADELVCTPRDRELFLAFAREELGTDIPERDLLCRLLCLRKRSRLPRSHEVTVDETIPTVQAQ